MPLCVVTCHVVTWLGCHAGVLSCVTRCHVAGLPCRRVVITCHTLSRGWAAVRACCRHVSRVVMWLGCHIGVLSRHALSQWWWHLHVAMSHAAMCHVLSCCRYVTVQSRRHILILTHILRLHVIVVLPCVACGHVAVSHSCPVTLTLRHIECLAEGLPATRPSQGTAAPCSVLAAAVASGFACGRAPCSLPPVKGWPHHPPAVAPSAQRVSAGGARQCQAAWRWGDRRGRFPPALISQCPAGGQSRTSHAVVAPPQRPGPRPSPAAPSARAAPPLRAACCQRARGSAHGPSSLPQLGLRSRRRVVSQPQCSRNRPGQDCGRVGTGRVAELGSGSLHSTRASRFLRGAPWTAALGSLCCRQLHPDP